MRVVRVAVAHARLVGVDTAAARAAPGVVAVLTAADLDPRAARSRSGSAVRRADSTPSSSPSLADGVVRYVGEPVAVVVADDPYAAEDAAELVDLGARRRSTSSSTRRARSSPTPRRSTAPATSRCTLARGYGDVDAAFERADRVVEIEIEVGRHTGVPLETRGARRRPRPRRSAG